MGKTDSGKGRWRVVVYPFKEMGIDAVVLSHRRPALMKG
jgi:hypothetical protein